MVKRLLLLLLLPVLAQAAIRTNNASGLFTDGAIWVGGTAPNASNDAFFITAGTTVEYDAYNTNYTFGASTINGSLIITNQTRPVWFEFNSTIAGTGTWNIGSASLPILSSSTNVETVVIRALTTSGITMTKSGGINWYGEDRNIAGRTWTTISGFADVGTNKLVLVDDLQLRTNDLIAVAPYIATNASATLPASTNAWFVVQSYDAPTKTVTLGANTNFLGVRYSGFNAAGTIPSLRSNTLCGVVLLSRSIVACSAPVGGVSLITGSDNGVMTGVAVSSNTFLVYNRSGWTFNSCTSAGKAIVSYANTASTVNNCAGSPVLNGLVYQGFVTVNDSATVYGDQFYSGSSVATSTGTTLNNCAGFGLLYGLVNVGHNASIFNSIVRNGYFGGLFQNSFACYASNSVVDDVQFGSLVAQCGNVLVENCIVLRARGFAGNGPGAFSYLSADCTVRNCSASNVTASTAGSLVYQCSRTVAENCFYSFTNGPAVLAYNTSIQHYGSLVNLTTDANIGTNVSYAGQDPRKSNMANPSRVSYPDGRIAYWWPAGVASNQTAVVPAPGTTALRHVVLNTFNVPVRWPFYSTVRANSTGRWNVWMNRPSLTVTQSCDLFLNSVNAPVIVPMPPQGALARVSNTSASNVWQYAELTWQNTNNVPVDVVVWSSVAGANGSVAYSWVEAGANNNIKVIP